jgi:hypothetical protein
MKFDWRPLFLAFGFLVGSSGASAAQGSEDSAELARNKEIEKSENPVLEANHAGIPASIAERIENLTPQELAARVASIQRALGRDGQSTLRMRVEVISMRDKAKADFKLLEGDAGVTRVVEYLLDEAFRNRLAELAKITDAKMLTASFASLLTDFRLDKQTLDTYKSYKRYQTILKRCDDVVKRLDEALSGTEDIPELLQRGPGRSTSDMLRRLDELEASLQGQKPKRDKKPTGTAAEEGDLQALIRSLLEP